MSPSAQMQKPETAENKRVRIYLFPGTFLSPDPTAEIPCVEGRVRDQEHIFFSDSQTSETIFTESILVWRFYWLFLWSQEKRTQTIITPLNQYSHIIQFNLALP